MSQVGRDVRRGAALAEKERAEAHAQGTCEADCTRCRGEKDDLGASMPDAPRPKGRPPSTKSMRASLPLRMSEEFKARLERQAARRDPPQTPSEYARSWLEAGVTCDEEDTRE